MQKKVRLNVYITEETHQQVKALAEKLGQSETRVGSLALQAGLDALRLATNPDWKTYFEAMIRTGQPVRLDDGTIIGAEE